MFECVGSFMQDGFVAGAFVDALGVLSGDGFDVFHIQVMISQLSALVFFVYECMI